MRLVQHELELTRLARGEQYQVAALVARAARASAAVDEGFEVLRQSVLYDVADGVYVEAAGRDVGRDEYGDAAAAQRRERVVALALAHVAVYRGGAAARVPQKSSDLLGFSHIRTLTSPSKRLRDGMM